MCRRVQRLLPFFFSLAAFIPLAQFLLLWMHSKFSLFHFMEPNQTKPKSKGKRSWRKEMWERGMRPIVMFCNSDRWNAAHSQIDVRRVCMFELFWLLFCHFMYLWVCLSVGMLLHVLTKQTQYQIKLIEVIVLLVVYFVRENFLK